MIIPEIILCILGTGALGGFYGANLQKALLNNTAKMKPYRTSMKIDYDERRTLEVEAIVGNPLRKALSLGLDLPQISCLYQQLKFLDAKNRKLLTVNS
jgi:2-dehydropantoate 2-reductase